MDDEKLPTVQYAPSYQQNPDLETHRPPTTGAQPATPTEHKPAQLTKANMKLFDRTLDVEEARRMGIPDCDISLGDCSVTSSEEYRRVLEQVIRNTKPEHLETEALATKYFEEYNAAHREEWERERKERAARDKEEYEREARAAAEPFLERIRKVPYDQAPTIKERGELSFAEEMAWAIRDQEHQAELYKTYAMEDKWPGSGAADMPSTEPRPQSEAGRTAETTADGNKQDHGHELGVADASHEQPEEDEMLAWANDPVYAELYKPYQPGPEPWIVKQQRMERDQQQRDQERREEMQSEDEKIDQRQEKLGFVQEERFVPPEHRQKPPLPSDHLKSLLPANFPRFREVHGMNDMGAYLANASYTVSLGGPPSADLKYGIIIVPVGEESTLFGTQPSDVMTPSFVQEVYDSRYTRHAAARADYHEASHDSAEFLRPRFASVDPDDRSLHSLDNLIDPGAAAGPEQSHDIHDEGNAESRHTKLAHAPIPMDDTSEAVNLDQTTDRLDTAQTVLYTGEA